MRTYAEDLCERILAASAAGTHAPGEVAAQFRVSVSLVHQLRQRTTGNGAAWPHRGGPAPLRNAAAGARLAACVARRPDATLAELPGPLAAEGGPAVGQPTAWNALRALYLRRKKSASTPPGA